MFNVFYVESPLQLLSAIQARKLFEGKSVLIVNISNGERVNNDQQINALIEENEWFRVYKSKVSTNSYVNFVLSTLKMLFFIFKYRGETANFFLGEIRNVDMFILGNALKSQETILLDDGTFTITAQRYYIVNKIPPFNLRRSSTRLKLTIFAKIFRFSIDEFYKVNLFSFFNLDKFLIENQINYFKQLPLKNISTEKGLIYFFGSKFSEFGYLSLRDELTILEGIYNKYSLSTIYYIPHRDEGKDKLTSIKSLGYRIKNLGMPAETYFNQCETMPESVLSCYSTVLYSCFIKFRNVSVTAIDIREYLKDEDAKINAHNIYEYYKEVGLNVIENS